MRRFASLFHALDAAAGTAARVEAMAAYFAEVPAADAAWALQVLLGKRRRRLITGRRLRQICLEASGLPDWLFDACHSQVGDSAETIALLWPGALDEPGGSAAAADPSGSLGMVAEGAVAATTPPQEGSAPPAVASDASAAAPRGDQLLSSPADQPLHIWMEQLLPAAAALEGEQQATAVRQLWQGLAPQQLLVACKLLTGGLRVGVAQGLVVRALARCSGLEEALLQHRLMGGFEPSATAWCALLAAGAADRDVPSRPYPFFLASPLQSDPDAAAPLEGPASDWLAEWKWDGIRGQLIHRQGGSFLWSRGEELIQDAFPELIDAAACLPAGTVLDGELLVWPAGEVRPAPFAQLQRRLGRKRPGRGLLAECPVVLLAYDLLERDGVDIRAWPLSRRRAALESLLRQVQQATDSPAAELLSPADTSRDALQAPAVPTRQADPGAASPGAEASRRRRRSVPEAGSPAVSPLPAAPAAGPLRLSPGRPLASWQELEALRQAAAAVNAEGLMLKSLASPYLAGRRRGHWWKHKRDPFTLDAVLLYAQAGSGRRANLFTDYTFGLWDREPASPDEEPGVAHAALRPRPDAAAVDAGRTGVSAEAPAAAGSAAGSVSGPPARRLVSFAKAYSGLDDSEILELDRWIRSHTSERFGPVRAVQPLQVFELAFEGLQRSSRHKSGIAVRFPRISRWRRDKPAAEADTLAAALALLQS